MVVDDYLMFYLMFETMLVVMVLAITPLWYSSRGVQALALLVLYTVVGSGILGVSLAMQYLVVGTTSVMHGIQYTMSSRGVANNPPVSSTHLVCSMWDVPLLPLC